MVQFIADLSQPRPEMLSLQLRGPFHANGGDPGFARWTRAMLQGTSENRLAMIDELESATAKLQDADRAIRERTQAMLAKTDLPEGFVQAEYQRETSSTAIHKRLPTFGVAGAPGNYKG